MPNTDLGIDAVIVHRSPPLGSSSMLSRALINPSPILSPAPLKDLKDPLTASCRSSLRLNERPSMPPRNTCSTLLGSENTFPSVSSTDDAIDDPIPGMFGKLGIGIRGK